MILWLAGLQGIPQHLYEAADLDGASAWHRFRHVTLPMLTPYIFFNLIMGTIGSLQRFTDVYVMSSRTGGPVDSTMVPVLYLFNNAFQYFKMGYASAWAWLIFFVVMAPDGDQPVGQQAVGPLRGRAEVRRAEPMQLTGGWRRSATWERPGVLSRAWAWLVMLTDAWRRRHWPGLLALVVSGRPHRQPLPACCPPARAVPPVLGIALGVGAGDYLLVPRARTTGSGAGSAGRTGGRRSCT